MVEVMALPANLGGFYDPLTQQTTEEITLFQFRAQALTVPTVSAFHLLELLLLES